MRPVLISGNSVQLRLSARTDNQLPQGEAELIHSRAPMLEEPLPAAAIEWATALTAATLPEAQPYPRLHESLEGLLSAIEAAPSASGWGAGLVQYEMLILAELGFGLDLDRCAASGKTDDLVAISPKSGRAVSAAEARQHADDDAEHDADDHDEDVEWKVHRRSEDVDILEREHRRETVEQIYKFSHGDTLRLCGCG